MSLYTWSTYLCTYNTTNIYDPKFRWRPRRNFGVRKAARWASTSTSIFMQIVAGGGYANNNIGWNARTAGCVWNKAVVWVRRIAMVHVGIRGFGIPSDDGIFQNVKTNIANLRPLVGDGSSRLWLATPHPHFNSALIYPSSLSCYFRTAFLSLLRPILFSPLSCRPSPSVTLFSFMSFVCMYMECHI